LSLVKRARHPNLTSYLTVPKCICVRRRALVWKKADLDKLEDALLKFQGRGVFEKLRRSNNVAAAVRRARATSASAKRAPKLSGQADLLES
jgi:hypothetical protein